MDSELQYNKKETIANTYKNDLLIRALNYHGQQLTSLIKDEPVFRQLDLKNVDYNLYQTRCPELRLEDRGYRLDLHRFIASNMKQIFKNDPKVCVNTISSENQRDTVVEKTNYEFALNKKSDLIVKKHSQHLVSANMPPYEFFASKQIDKEDRLRHVFEILSISDVLYCRVSALNASGLLLNVCCFAGTNLNPQNQENITASSRYMDDLKIKCFCPADELVGASENLAKDKGRIRSYETGDFVCVVVLEVKRDVQRLLVSMKCSTLQCPDVAANTCRMNGIRLGLVSNGVSNLPLEYQKTIQATEETLSYNSLLEKSEGFWNPTNVEALATEIGLSNLAGNATLMPNLGPFPNHSYAKQLRKRQNSNASFRHVAQGVKHFKSGETSEAFQCLNAALRIDEENVEGFVARGALYANNGSLKKAIEDFEAALKIRYNHKNAQKYHQETLMAMALKYEDENNLPLARDTYNKVMLGYPDNAGARRKLCLLLASHGRQMERERNIEEAVNAYSNAIAAEPGNKEAKCLLLSLKMRNKDSSIDKSITEKLKR